MFQKKRTQKRGGENFKKKKEFLKREKHLRFVSDDLTLCENIKETTLLWDEKERRREKKNGFVDHRRKKRREHL